MVKKTKGKKVDTEKKEIDSAVEETTGEEEVHNPTKENSSLIKEIIIQACPEPCRRAILKGQIIAEEVNKTRTLSKIGRAHV